MRTISRIVVAAALLVFVAGIAPAMAQKTKLEFKGKKSERLRYDINVGGTLDLDLNEMPLPRSTLKMENAKVAVGATVYLETLKIEDGDISYDLKANVDRLLLGGLIKLDGLGLKSTTVSPTIMLTISPDGKIKALDMPKLELPTPGGQMPKLPGLDMLGSGAGEMASLFAGMMPAIFPEEELGPGDTWKKEINFDQMMGLGDMLPRVPFNFKLVSIDGDVANIEFTYKGKYDGAMLNTFLALIPEIPLGDDVLKIANIKLLVSWDGNGAMKFDTAKGRLDELSMSTVYLVDVGANTTFKHPDDSTEDWNSTGKVKLIIDMGAKYAGAPSAEEVNLLFPAEKKKESAKKPAPKGKNAKKTAPKSGKKI